MRRPDRETKDRERILEILRTYDSIVPALNTGHRVFADEALGRILNQPLLRLFEIAKKGDRVRDFCGNERFLEGALILQIRLT